MCVLGPWKAGDEGHLPRPEAVARVEWGVGEVRV